MKRLNYQRMIGTVEDVLNISENDITEREKFIIKLFSADINSNPKPKGSGQKYNTHTVLNAIYWLSDKAGIDPDELMQRTRRQGVVILRQQLFYIIKSTHKLEISYPDIARVFGMNHATVIYSVNKVEDLMDVDINYRERTLDLKQAYLNEVILKSDT